MRAGRRYPPGSTCKRNDCANFACTTQDFCKLRPAVWVLLLENAGVVGEILPIGDDSNELLLLIFKNLRNQLVNALFVVTVTSF